MRSDFMRRSLCGGLIIWLVTVVAKASMWVDPDWDKMLKESELIVLAEVTKGGKYMATIKPLNVFKGEGTQKIEVSGYNNRGWPSEAIREQSFETGQRYYLFLKRVVPPEPVDPA